ncbi:MAG: hypothetical protein AB1420_00660 [Bacillota bacterium]
MNWKTNVFVSNNASGAYAAAKKGHIVVIVDVIDMSTSLETVLEMGAIAIFGASPDFTEAPVPVFPEIIGFEAARIAIKYGTDIIIIGEPRFGSETERSNKCMKLINAISSTGVKVHSIVPNVGKEIALFADYKDRVVVAVSDSGGVAFDAAFNAGGLVSTATIARTFKRKGQQPGMDGALRAFNMAKQFKKDITVVAASSNSWEDVLAADYLRYLIEGLS